MITNIVYGYFIMFQYAVINTVHVIIIYNFEILPECINALSD